ncbi:hypothetical protein JQN64_28550, partial [Escherichia coli]|nr:hypothetical protein [Escherichia coli]
LQSFFPFPSSLLSVSRPSVSVSLSWRDKKQKLNKKPRGCISAEMNQKRDDTKGKLGKRK